MIAMELRTSHRIEGKDDLRMCILDIEMRRWSQVFLVHYLQAPQMPKKGHLVVAVLLGLAGPSWTKLSDGCLRW